MSRFSRSLLVLALAGLSAAGPALAGRGRTVNLETFPVDPQLCRIDSTPTAPGLAELRATLAPELPAAGSDLSAVQLQALAARLSERLAGLPQAAMDPPCQRPFDLLVSDMREGTELMRIAAHLPARRVGLLKVVQALNLYGHQFKPAGWQPLHYQPQH